MPLCEHEKEELVQTHIIESQLDEIPYGNDAQLRRIARDAAKVAFETLFRFRFGFLEGVDTSIVYVNMGPDKARILEGLRRRLREEDVDELAAAFWPEEGEDKHYTFAILIDSIDPDYWCDVAREVYISIDWEHPGLRSS